MLEPSSVIPIIVGYQSMVRPDAREDLQLDDMGYETPKTNDKYRDRFLAAMQDIKLLGHLVRIVAADPARNAFLDTAQLKYEPDFAKEGLRNPAQAFAGWLLEAYGKPFTTGYKINPNIKGSNELLFFGFDLKPMLRILGPSCNVDARSPIPLGLWFANDDCWDPYEMMVEAEYRGKEGHPPVIPLAKVLKRVGMRLRPDYRFHADALADCVLAAEMVYRFGLSPVASSAGLADLLKTQLTVAAASAATEPEVQPSAAKPAAGKTKKGK